MPWNPSLGADHVLLYAMCLLEMTEDPKNQLPVGDGVVGFWKSVMDRLEMVGVDEVRVKAFGAFMQFAEV